MKSRGTSPVVLRRRIAREIRGLRQQTGLSLDAVSELTSVTKSTLSRMEKGHTAPKVSILRLLLEAYRAPSGKQDELERLAREANRRGWWSQHYGDVEVPDWLSTYVGLESEAAGLEVFHQMVPGLLQTEEYARAVIAAWAPDQRPELVEGRVRLRMSRQQRIAAGLQLRVVLDEAALHRMVASRRVMAAQLAHLAALADRSGITLQVLPFAQPAAPVLAAPFVILSFADDDPAVVYLEAFDAGFCVEEPDRVEQFRLVFRRLSEAALGPAESGVLIAKLARRYARGA